MTRDGRHWDAVAGLERKVWAAGRPWTVGDIVMVAEAQWAVGTSAGYAEPADEDVAVVEARAVDRRRVELSVEELARAVGARLPEAHRDESGK